MFCRSYSEATKQAKANARYFNVPYVVFSDQAGNWRCERLTKTVNPLSSRKDAIVFRPGRRLAGLGR
jgi:hypothetical protein